MAEKSIVLTGIKHCGKTTLGKILAEKLSYKFIDTDDIIFQMTQKSPREIYQTGWQTAFLEAEKNACFYIKNLVAKSTENFIVATGGGICENDIALSVLKEIGILVFLETTEKTAADRIISEIKISNGTLSNLPAYIAKKNPKTETEVREIFHEVFEKRSAAYKSNATICVSLKNASPEENALAILHEIKRL